MKKIYILLIYLISMPFWGSSCDILEDPPPYGTKRVVLNYIAISWRAFPAILELMINDDTCILPCFWGLQPGETTSAEVEVFIKDRFGDLYDKRTGIYLHLQSWRYSTLRVNFEFDNQTEKLIYIYVSNVPPLLSNRIKMSAISSQMNSQPSIYIGVNPQTKLFSISIMYNEQGVMSKHIFRFGPNQLGFNEPMLICPHFEQNTFIEVWLQSDLEETFVQNRVHPNLQASDFYKPLQDVINISPEEFIERIISDPDVCFEALPYNEVY